MTSLKRKVDRFASRKILFTDLFDTLIHRTVHPNYVLKLWAKIMVRELGLPISADRLFSIRSESLSYLVGKQKCPAVEVGYKEVIKEVHHRLITSDLFSDMAYERYEKAFQNADYMAEISVQFKNEALVSDLAKLKEHGGYTIHLVSDCYLSKKIIVKIADYHKISYLFDDMFISCSLGKSKESGSIYPYILNQTNTMADTALMMGDNKKSDFVNAENSDIKAIHLKHRSHKLRNKQNLFGNDANNFKKVCKAIEWECQKSGHPFSEYVLHFYFFIERLYTKARKDGIKNLFFLAREGLYLKRLFDAYQDMSLLSDSSKINTHYLKMSRQSAVQLAFRPLPEEDFSAFKARFGKISLPLFFDGLRFSNELRNQISQEIGKVSVEPSSDFFNSNTMLKLRANPTFAKHYEKYRINQKVAFHSYLDSFGVDIEKEGMHLVDIGWGGTMQEKLYGFLENRIPVTGFYLGLKEVYDIRADTKRFGLNFSVYPSRSFSDDVLKANGQLYEQLLGAPHGSTIAYTNENEDSFTVEFHEKNEKLVFEKMVRPIQEYMFVKFERLFKNLRSIDYSQGMAQEYMTNMALRTGIFMSKDKIRFINQLSKGFYQNIGENKVGVTYSPKQLKISKLTLLTRFIKSPEQLFRYLVKVKPFMYTKGLYWISWPLNLTYFYIKLNFWFKKKWLNKGLVS